MSDIWVLDRLFKAFAAEVDWGAQQKFLEYEGAVALPDEPPEALQFRWLLHPALGLPREPFTLSRAFHPGGNPTVQELANLPTWQDIERVGLPVDDSWGDTGYDLSAQGLVSSPSSPIDAADRRLHRGAPRIGWTKFMVSSGEPLPGWEPTDVDGYLRELLRTTLLAGIHRMLARVDGPAKHAAYTETAEEIAGGRFDPRLLLDDAVGLAGGDTPSAGEWQPLGLALLGARADPLAALALGFGTTVAQIGEPGEIFRISVRHRLAIPGFGEIDIQLADVITPNDRVPPPEPPTQLGAATVSRTRAQVTDGPSLDSVAVTWQRMSNPVFAHQPDAPDPISYVVGRADAGHEGTILLAPRPNGIGGYLPFVPTKPTVDSPARFVDHLARANVLDGKVVGRPFGSDHAYAVAAQDAFGRYSRWSETTYTDGDEPPAAPSIYSVTIDLNGMADIVFSWDWSMRSPEFMEIRGAFEDDPSSTPVSARLDFGGFDQPDTHGAEITPLAQDLSDTEGFGPEQDPDSGPATRFYRMRRSVALGFPHGPRRVLAVRARGQAHLHDVFLPGGNVSPFGAPRTAEMVDPEPPARPLVQAPEAPQWATLRDGSGVSRAVLRWTGDTRVAGYVLYEATESALLAAHAPGSRPEGPFTERLRVIRALDPQALRPSFRRVRRDLIPPRAPQTTFEVSLPRGSGVMHVYALTAVSHNGVESSWPFDGHSLFAVAAPHTVMPAPPLLEATPGEPAGPPLVKLRASVDGATRRLELFRVHDHALAASADTMGRPISVVTPANGMAELDDATVSPGWKRIWYRAVAWSGDDPLGGALEARSPASAAVPVLLPPPSGPAVTDLRVDEPGSTATDVLVSWSVDAPATPTPFGPYLAIVEVHDSAPDGQRSLRIEGEVSDFETVASAPAIPPADPANRAILRVGTPESFRLYAWLPRPAAGQPAWAVAKAVDPLGRTARVEAQLSDVPPGP